MNNESIEFRINGIGSNKIGTMIDLLKFFNCATIPDLAHCLEFRDLVDRIMVDCKQVLFLGCSSNGDRLDLVFPTMIASLSMLNGSPIVSRSSTLFKM
jgi:hypothetical protein